MTLEKLTKLPDFETKIIANGGLSKYLELGKIINEQTQSFKKGNRPTLKRVKQTDLYKRYKKSLQDIELKKSLIKQGEKSYALAKVVYETCKANTNRNCTKEKKRYDGWASHLNLLTNETNQLINKSNKMNREVSAYVERYNAQVRNKKSRDKLKNFQVNYTPKLKQLINELYTIYKKGKTSSTKN